VSEVPAPGGYGTLYGVSCTSPTDCTAVGDDGNGKPAYVTESAGSWGPVTEIGGFGVLFGVSCTAAMDCTAVGYDTLGPIYATEAAGTWGPATQIPSPKGVYQLASVSCTSATSCIAVGGGPIYAAESNGSWGAVTKIAATGFRTVLDFVSCADARHCTAVGSDFYAGAVYAGDPSVPGAPVLTEATARSNAIRASWTAPAWGGGYAITRYTASAVRGYLVRSCVTTTTSCTIPGLRNGTTYWVSVVATNMLGNSPTSNMKRAKPRK
jgi:hypothetical protein